MESHSYTEHKTASVGDTARITTRDKTTYIGTVTHTPGATVYIQTNTKQILEIRRINSDPPQVLLSIDGKTSDYRTPKTGFNQKGIRVTQESGTHSFDKIVESFESETQELTIG